MKEKGRLYILPTPIGNLKDISLRTIDILKEVDFILCEDTRNTIKILKYLEIEKRLISYHEHNEIKRGHEVIDWLKNGKNIALVSDAGMPCISDPGRILVDFAHKNDIDIIVVPGANAAITAVVASGFDSSKFQFLGFLSRNKSEKNKELLETGEYDGLSIIYESPHRLIKTLSDIRDLFPKREILVARELTKLHEELFRGSVEEALNHFEESKIRGEIVIVLNKSKIEKEIIDIDKELKYMMELGLSSSKAVKEIAKKYNLNKNEVYKKSLDIKNEKQN